jgi:hypothetical protein
MTVIFWFRRDLRVQDNEALLASVRRASSDNAKLAVAYVFGRGFDELSPIRRNSLITSVSSLSQTLPKGLQLISGETAKNLLELAQELQAKVVYATRSFDTHGMLEQSEVAEQLYAHGISLQLVGSNYAVEPGTEFGDRWKIFRGATDFFFYFLILKELFRVFALLYVMFYTNKYKKIPKELISFVELSPFVPMLGFVGSAFCSDVCAKQDNSFLSNLLSSGIAEGFLTYLPFVALTGKYTLDVAPNSAWDHSTFGAFFGLWMSVGICLRSRSGESTTSQENRKSLLSDYA